MAREEELETTVAIFWYPEASPMGGEAVFKFVLCFWLNQQCLMVRSKEGKRRHTIPSSSKKSFTNSPGDPHTWLLFPFACEKSEAHMSEKPCVKVF